ncbi:hypothetical protein [uncultured Anaerococcus sp.]|uniref:hypothetical protein n=1 Tax=uncultured Anaerococcus sp. TaxID=293428 RepID=UPI002636EBC9|nr:hypothetical protein [uncultured Anaerococcus sp.]
MKRFKINFMDLLALILLIGSFFLPFEGRISLDTDTILMLINCYLISYLSFLISFMETRKVIIMALPLLIYSVFLIFFMENFNFSFQREYLDDLTYIITNLFDLIFVVFVFFIIELILNRLLGAKLTSGLVIFGLIVYLVMQNTGILPFDFYYKDTLAYFAFFVMGARIRPANSINKGLYILAILLVAGEIYINYYFNYYPGINFSLFIISYLILKGSSSVDTMTRDRYLVFTYIYPYKLIYVILSSIINASSLVVTLVAVLITFIIGELLYKLRIKFLDYLLVGVH